MAERSIFTGFCNSGSSPLPTPALKWLGCIVIPGLPHARNWLGMHSHCRQPQPRHAQPKPGPFTVTTGIMHSHSRDHASPQPGQCATTVGNMHSHSLDHAQPLPGQCTATAEIMHSHSREHAQPQPGSRAVSAGTTRSHSRDHAQQQPGSRTATAGTSHSHTRDHAQPQPRPRTAIFTYMNNGIQSPRVMLNNLRFDRPHIIIILLLFLYFYRTSAYAFGLDHILCNIIFR